MNSPVCSRVVEIQEPGRYLHKSRGFLVVEADGHEIGRVPLDDIAAVLTSTPATSVSASLISELSTRGVPLVLCGRNFLPTAIVWPLVGHHQQQRHMELQVEATRPLRKQLWAQVVVSKIEQQGAALSATGGSDQGFALLAKKVRSGDPANVEAQAARRYWGSFFGPDFRRRRDAEGSNALLNYGYTILRSAAARAIVAAGLHPGVSIFHRHPHNPMPLADDLMEPFRPFVDLRVRALVLGGANEVGREEKTDLADLLRTEIATEAGNSPLSLCLVRLARSLAQSFADGKAGLQLPTVQSGGSSLSA
jgi:CRISPR-associated protein Cas1